MSECGHCRDCKWWDGRPDFQGWGTCDRFVSIAQDMKPGAMLKVWTTTKRGQVMVETGDGFGCVQWEQRES